MTALNTVRCAADISVVASPSASDSWTSPLLVKRPTTFHSPLWKFAVSPTFEMRELIARRFADDDLVHAGGKHAPFGDLDLGPHVAEFGR